MGSRQIRVGDPVVDHFPVFDLDGYTKKSGETTFTSVLWKDGVESVVSVSISEIASSGEYKVSFTPDTVGVWSIQVFVNYNKDWWGADIYAMVRRLLGLSHENIFIDETQYDADGQLVTARVRLFDSKTNCDAATDGGTETTGLIATYSLQTNWEAINEFQIFKQTLEP
jgi:hypothetical protein